MERIFIDKLFAAEAYVRKANIGNRAIEAAKHIYDLVVLSSQERIVNLISDDEMMSFLLNIRMEEELNRRDGIPNVIPRKFQVFEGLATNTLMKDAFSDMQDLYVFDSKNIISYTEATDVIACLGENLLDNHSWFSREEFEKEIEEGIER